MSIAAKVYYAILIVFLLPLILAWKFVLEPLAMLADFAVDQLVRYRREVAEWALIVLFAVAFLGVQFGAIHLMLQNPEVRAAVDNYKRACGGPAPQPPCR